MGFLDIPIVGDLAGSALDFAFGSELQEDSQAHSAQMFEKQKQHEVEQWGRESEWSSAQAEKAYGRQRSLLQDSPGLQMKGLKSAGLNPILAATGGFKSPAGGSMPIPSARASASAKGGGAGLSSVGKVQLGQARLLHEQAKLTSAQKAKVKAETEITPTYGDKNVAGAEQARAEVKKAEAEARYKNASTEGVLMDNVKKANLANVYDDAFGQFLTYAKEIGLAKILTLGAMVLGPAALARYLAGKVTKQHLPKIISLGNRFWKPGAAREFRDIMMKKYRGNQ